MTWAISKPSSSGRDLIIENCKFMDDVGIFGGAVSPDNTGGVPNNIVIRNCWARVGDESPGIQTSGGSRLYVENLHLESFGGNTPFIRANGTDRIVVSGIVADFFYKQSTTPFIEVEDAEDVVVENVTLQATSGSMSLDSLVYLENDCNWVTLGPFHVNEDHYNLTNGIINDQGASNVTIRGLSVIKLPFSIGGDFTVSTGSFRLPITEPGSIRQVYATAGTAPTGQSAIFDVNLNGTTVFTTQGNRPTIPAGSNISSAAVPDVKGLSEGDYLTVDVDQIGSTVAGADGVVVVEMLA